MVKPQSIVDIVVVGAGLVGTPLALALSSHGWSVCLLDAGTAIKPSESDLQQRCTALSLGTQQWFAAQQLWDTVSGDAEPIEQVVVSHKGYFGATRLNAAELGVDAVGYVVNNERFIASLSQHLDQSTIDYRTGSRVVSVIHQVDHVQVQLEQAEPVCAPLLIAADGVSSVVRESVGISTTQVDYDQAAVLGTLKLKGAHSGVAYERFTDSGPLALLPRTGSYMSFVDCINPAEQHDIGQLDDAQYLARLQSRFGYRLGQFDAVGTRLMTPLVRIEATAQTSDRTVLLGNAMRLLHPVGGQGYNLAMRDVDQLVRMLGLNRNADPGNTQILQKFVQSRRADQQQVVQFTDALARGFRGSAALPGHLRSAALLGLDLVSPLRRQFARRTMGLVSQ